MEAKDLMIGDWVTTPKIKGKITILSEVGICVAVNGVSVKIPIDEIAPIPLTAVILEKNGFKWDGSGQSSMMCISPFDWSETEVRYNIYVGLKHKTIEVFVAPPVEKKEGWRKSNKVYLEYCGCYVHELQHALRLCGIEKEIVI